MAQLLLWAQHIRHDHAGKRAAALDQR